MPRTHMTPILEDLTPKVESQPFKKFFFWGGWPIFSGYVSFTECVYVIMYKAKVGRLPVTNGAITPISRVIMPVIHFIGAI